MIKLINGDITKFTGDVIVNAANTSLLGGGGVDGAIHKAAGPNLLIECRKLNGCNYGQAKITNSYNLACQKIIHIVGPKYNKMPHKKARQLLIDAYYNSLQLAKQNNLHSIAFPAISCGVYKYPFNEATKISLEVITNWLNQNANYQMDVTLVYFSKNELHQAKTIFKSLKGKN